MFVCMFVTTYTLKWLDRFRIDFRLSIEVADTLDYRISYFYPTSLGEGIIFAATIDSQAGKAGSKLFSNTRSISNSTKSKNEENDII